MYGSGVKIGMMGMMRIITEIVHTGILRDQIQALAGFFAVARGTITRGTSAVRIGAGSHQASGTSTSGFVLPVPLEGGLII